MAQKSPFESWITEDPLGDAGWGHVAIAEDCRGREADGELLTVTLELDAARFHIDQSLGQFGFEEWLASEVATSRLAAAERWLDVASSVGEHAWDADMLLELCDLVTAAQEGYAELAALVRRQAGSDDIVLVDDPKKLAEDLHAMTCRLQEAALHVLPGLCRAAGEDRAARRRRRQIMRDLTCLTDHAAQTVKNVA